MKGAIVYNGFWNREGPSDPVQRLQKAAAERGIPLAAFPNTALTAMFGPDGPAVLGLPEADFGKHDVADDPSLFFRDQRKFGDEGAAFSEPRYKLMFRAVAVFGVFKGPLHDAADFSVVSFLFSSVYHFVVSSIINHMPRASRGSGQRLCF